MIIYVASVPSCCLLSSCDKINPATNRKITAQNYCPPCQLGKLPSSRISTYILALRAQNLQQLSVSPDQKPQCPKLCAHSKSKGPQKMSPLSNDPPANLPLSLIPPSLTQYLCWLFGLYDKNRTNRYEI
jgi:hypothetical protein